MEKGYDVFGKAYGVMNRNDLHALESIDHKLMQEMILLSRQFFCMSSKSSFSRGDPPKGILGLQNHEYHVIAVLLFKWNDPHDNLHEISTSKILNDDSYEIPRITVSSQCIKNGASRSLRRKLHTGSRVLQGPHIRSKTNGTDAKDDCGIHHGTRSFHTEFKTIIIRTGIVVKKSYDS